MAEKIFDRSNVESKDNSNFRYSVLTRNNDGLRKSTVRYVEDEKKSKIIYELDKANLELYKNNGSLRFKLELDNYFKEFIEELDELSIGNVYKNSEKWFKKSIDYDKIDTWYVRIIRTKSSKSYILLDIPKNLEIKDRKGNPITLEELTNQSKVQIEFSGLELYSNKIVPIYTVISVVCYKNKKREECLFSEDDNDNLETDSDIDIDIDQLVENNLVVETSVVETSVVETSVVETSVVETSVVEEEIKQIDLNCDESTDIFETKIKSFRENRKKHRERTNV
jgi:hypothetical protein